VRLFRLLIALSVVTIITINAQNKLTVDEAIILAYENNIELQNQYARIRNAEIELDESGRIPNPLFSYSRADLNFKSLNYNEWVASGSIPINFLWDRWSNLDSKEKTLDAQKVLLNQKKLNIALDVRDNYFTLYSYSDLSTRLNKTLSRLTELAESAKHRLAEGDISEYELQRILLELNKLKVTAAEIGLQRIKHENSLKLLIGVSSNDIMLSGMKMKVNDINYTKEELIKAALENRNDLKSFQLLIESENMFLSHNKLKIIPNINLTAGYKEQLDNFKGTVIQVDFEIPLFNRNQKIIQQSENSLSLLEKELMFLKEKINTEVSEAYTRLTVNKNLSEGQNDIELENIFNTAVYSYEQGEITLVELIDGINAFVDGSRIANEVEINYMRSFYELEKAVGISINNFE